MIRAAQLEALRLAAVQRFEDRAIAYFLDHWPALFERDDGDAFVRGVVRLAIARAADHGLETEHDAIGFALLMFALGMEFDRDSTYAWAAEILAEHTRGDRVDEVLRRAAVLPQPKSVA